MPDISAEPPSPRRRRYAMLALVLFVLLLPTLVQFPAGDAAQARFAEQSGSHAAHVAPQRDPDFVKRLAELSRVAQADGSVQVIVTLGVPTVPEGSLTTATDVADQRRRIEQAQDAVQSRLAAHVATIRHRYV
ncbi:MAG: hypothetical protein EOM24_05540, partial [Chloroflexia bacterium]|nr:hypothetical protein [Chloroflexia bacterium]